jgi:ActR/RegA family two-component response regulator
MTAAVEETGYRPCVLIAHADPVYAARASREFRRRGWDPYEARTGPEARRLARMLEPALVVLGTELPEESGWLTCDKLTREDPSLDVFLVADAPDVPGEHFASFAGAAGLVAASDGVEALLHVVEDVPLPVAG